MVKKSTPDVGQSQLENTIESGNANVNNISDNNPLKKEVEQVYDGDKRTNEVSNEAIKKATPEQKGEVINSRWDRWDKSDNKFLNRYSGHDIFEGMSDEDLDDYENNVKDNKSLSEFVDRYNSRRDAEQQARYEKARAAFYKKKDWVDNNRDTYNAMSDVDRAALDKELDKLHHKMYIETYREPSDRLYNYTGFFRRHNSKTEEGHELSVPENFNNWKEYKAARDKDEADYNRITNIPAAKNLIDAGLLTIEKNSPKNYGSGYDIDKWLDEVQEGDDIFSKARRAIYNGYITPEQWKKEFGEFHDKMQAEADELNRKYPKPPKEMVEDWEKRLAASIDEFCKALFDGNTKKAEDIVEENPEVASVLPDDVPLKEEAEQITDDSDKRNDEVKDEAVKETSERLSNDFETVDDLMNYVESIDKNEPNEEEVQERLDTPRDTPQDIERESLPEELRSTYDIIKDGDYPWWKDSKDDLAKIGQTYKLMGEYYAKDDSSPDNRRKAEVMMKISNIIAVAGDKGWDISDDYVISNLDKYYSQGLNRAYDIAQHKKEILDVLGGGDKHDDIMDVLYNKVFNKRDPVESVDADMVNEIAGAVGDRKKKGKKGGLTKKDFEKAVKDKYYDIDKDRVGEFLKKEEERKGMLGDGGSGGVNSDDETVVGDNDIKVDEAIDSMEDELEDDIDVNDVDTSDIPDSDSLEDEEVEDLERQLNEDEILNDDNVEEEGGEGREEPFKEDIPGEEDADDNGIPDDDDPLFKEDVFDDPYDFYMNMKGAEREAAKKAMRDDAKYKPINPADLITGLDFTDEEKEKARENIRKDLKEGKNGKIFKTLDMFHKSHIWELSDEEKEILKRTILEDDKGSFGMPNLSVLGSRPGGHTGSLVSGHGGAGSGSDLRTSSSYRASSTGHSSGPAMGLPSGALGFSSPHASGSSSPRSMYSGGPSRRAGGGSIPNNNVSSGRGSVIQGHQSKSSGFVTNNGAVSSGATQTRSTLARPSPKADLPSFFGHTDMSGAAGSGFGLGSGGSGDLKGALIERIHGMLSSLPPEVVKEMGFTPVNHLYKGSRLESLDGGTLSELSQELEEVSNNV